ncbi:hypothetical protein QBC37DRAFT_112085 [Rhypophila decipiens]|uniref:Uncharacterized protein n=1 Tax=Rhypophila decipiens TaxID=261697 RepID=A0AAN7BDG6_9PEZI|nr:hypothetical protein QBC37DRAFT_112085 [Rhypophila decipiens]
MSFPAVTSDPSFLSKCGNTFFCFLRNAPLWIVVIVVFLFGALRQWYTRFNSSRPSSPPISPSPKTPRNSQ